MNERKNIIFKNEWKNKKTWQVEIHIQIEWKELKTRKNKKTITKYTIRQIRALIMNTEQKTEH